MRSLNVAGVDLIKSHEGLRLKAYPDPGSGGEPWTIGYGHASPEVDPGMTITKATALTLLTKDLETFCALVESKVKVELTDNQFAALVSFCYNVGGGNFSKSSALKAVNAKKFALVPSKLALYNQASGKVMAGLVRRRAEEGALFIKGSVNTSDAKLITGAEAARGTPLLSSTTNIAAVVSAVGTVAATAKQMSGDVAETVTGLGITGVWFGITIAIIGVATSIWIIKERMWKSQEDGA